MKTEKIIFFGTPPFAAESLKKILESGRKVPLVITQPDRPAGRGQKVMPGAIKRYCEENKIPFLQPKKLKDETFLSLLKEANAALYVVAAYGRILPRVLLDSTELTLNVHASLLPRWRGAAPIERAILAGDKETGISIMRLVEELDAGDVILQKKIDVGADETGGELYARMMELGGGALVEALNLIDKGDAHFESQNTQYVTFAPPIQVEEGKISWTETAEKIHNQIRAFQPRPGAYTSDGKWRIKIHRSLRTGISSIGITPGNVKKDGEKFLAACKDEWIEILEIQREGRERQTGKIFATGYLQRGEALWE